MKSLLFLSLRIEGAVSGQVRHVVVPVIGTRLCNSLYDKIAEQVKLEITEDMMCAGLETGGKDACQVKRDINN